MSSARVSNLACSIAISFSVTLVARHGIEPCPLAFQTSTLPSSSRAEILVDGARLELAFHGCRPWVIPLYEPPNWGEMRESNSRDWSHNPVPKPFGQSRHKNLELVE